MRVCVGDIEGNGLLDTATRVWCGVFKDINTGEVFKFTPNQIKDMLSFLNKEVGTLIMHYGYGYDLPLLRKCYQFEFKGKLVDTLIMSRLFKPNRKLPPQCPNRRAGIHSVEAWGYRVGRGKVEHGEWGVYSDKMLHRCAEDVEIQHLIYNALVEEGKKHDWERALALTHKLFEILQKQEEYGWLVDRDHMEKSIAFLSNRMALIDKVVSPYLPLKLIIEEQKVKGEYKYVSKPFKKDGQYSQHTRTWVMDRFPGNEHNLSLIGGPYSRICFRKISLDSNMETKDFLLREGWIPEEWNFNDNGKRTSPKLSKDDPFEGVNGKLGRLVAKRVQCRHRRSTLEGWVRLIRPDGKIPSVVTGIATTGRVTHANIVNVPGGDSFFARNMRKCFTSKKGFVLVGTDSDACQVRMLVARMKDDDYKNTVLNGKKEHGTDIHTVNQKAAGLPRRADAKPFFYGLLFGAGDLKLGKIINGTAKEGGVLRQRFMSKLPAYAELVDSLAKEWRSHAKQRMNKWGKLEYYDGWIKGLDGRPIFIESEHKLLVFMLQSDEAIMMAAAYCYVYKWMEEAGYVWGRDWGFTCWYHDEYTVECKEEIAEDVSKITARAIKKAGELYKIDCPHKGNAVIGKNWWDIH